MEELEDRFGERMETILEDIQSVAASTGQSNTDTWAIDPALMETSFANTADGFGEDEDAVFDEEMFDDGGEGAGVEGDLDLDDD